jgi:hypothetical protein
MRQAWFLLWVLMPVPGFACKCLVSYPVCQEVAATDFVFIGTVESVEPRFLDPAQAPIDEITRLQRDDSASSLARLRQIYLKMLATFRTRLGANCCRRRRTRNSMRCSAR